MNSSVSDLSVDEGLVTGVDVGGTKVHIADSINSNTLRYSTDDFVDMESLLEAYFTKVNAKPTQVVVAMAGPRHDKTGRIKLTNHSWPAFLPLETAKKYGIRCVTVNDMVATVAGVLNETSIDFQALKKGASLEGGNKLVISLSTGLGVAAAVWDSRSKRYVTMSTEGGHISVQPKNQKESRYLQFLHKKYPHPSAEIALSGKIGLKNLVDFFVDDTRSPGLAKAIKRARKENTPVGAVLFEFCSHGSGQDRQTASTILRQLGTMFGSVLRDLAVAYKATGGIYITGSVALALGEYFVTHSEFIDRFIREGAVHDSWIKDIPINLVTNPDIAVAGALALAKDPA